MVDAKNVKLTKATVTRNGKKVPVYKGVRGGRYVKAGPGRFTLLKATTVRQVGGCTPEELQWTDAELDAIKWTTVFGRVMYKSEVHVFFCLCSLDTGNALFLVLTIYFLCL